MTAERWPQVKALFQAAVERPTEERDAFLAAVTGDDEALRREVESLLTSDASDVSFLDLPPFTSGPVLADPLAAPLASIDHTRSLAVLTPGLRVGPYEIVAPLGAGAMGEVFRACDTKLNRVVALKVLPERFALDRLEKVDAELARIVELRAFGGLTIEEAAHVLGVSPSTAKRDFRTAKAWLTRELGAEVRP